MWVLKRAACFVLAVFAAFLAVLGAGYKTPLLADEEEPAACMDLWSNGPNPNGFGLIIEGITHEGRYFTGFTGAIKISPEFQQGILRWAKYDLNPDPVESPYLTWDGANNYWRRWYWHQNKADAWCFRFGTTFIIKVFETYGYIDWLPVMEDTCDDPNEGGCGDGEEGGGQPPGSGGGAPDDYPVLVYYRCSWHYTYDMDTGEILSVTFMGCQQL